MPAVVSSVVQGSIADELAIEEGDILLSIDGEKLLDMIDYRFLCKNEFITIEIQKKNGEIEEIELEKDFDEDLGIVFESSVSSHSSQKGLERLFILRMMIIDSLICKVRI